MAIFLSLSLSNRIVSAQEIGLGPSGLGMTVGTGLTSMPDLAVKGQAVWDVHLSLRPALWTSLFGPTTHVHFGVTGASSADGGYLYNGFTHTGASVGMWVDLATVGLGDAVGRSLLELRGGGSIGQYRNTNSLFFAPHVSLAWLYPVGPPTGIWRWWLSPAVTWSIRDPEVTTVQIAVSIGGGIATVPVVAEQPQ